MTKGIKIPDHVKFLKKQIRRYENDMVALNAVKHTLDPKFLEKAKTTRAKDIAAVEQEIKRLTKTMTNANYYGEQE